MMRGWRRSMRRGRAVLNLLGELMYWCVGGIRDSSMITV